jgi:hypothetical protein
VVGCRENREVICQWLKEDSAKMAAADGIAVDPNENDWGPMVDEAIRRAEEKENAAR